MRKRLGLLICVAAAFISCGHDLDSLNESAKLEKAQSALGVKIDGKQDWMMTSNGTVTISNFPNDIKTDSVFVYDADPFADSTATILYARANEGKSISFELPSYLNKVFVACKTSNGSMRSRSVIPGGSVDFSTPLFNVSQKAQTRVAGNLPSASELSWQPTLNKTLFASQGWADEFAIIDGGGESVSFTYDEFEHANHSFTNFFHEGHYNNRILYTYDEVRNCMFMTIGKGGGSVTLTPVHKQSDQGQMFGYYYFDKGDERNVKTVKKYVFSDKIYKVENKKDGSTQSTYKLIYYDKNGNPSYTFPEGTEIGLFCHITDIKKDLLVDFYAEGELNYDVSDYLYNQGIITNNNIKQGRSEWKTLNHVAYTNRNGVNYVGFEDYIDFDLNDLVLMIDGNIEPLPETPARDFIQGTDDKQQWHIFTFAYEDTQNGDYDLNDVVMQVWLQQQYVWGVGNRPCFKVRLVAVGAKDPLTIHYRDAATGEVHNLFDGKEVHEVMGVEEGSFVNTETINVTKLPECSIFRESDYYGIEKVTISRADFYIKNLNTGDEIHTPASQNLIGHAPMAICVPKEWRWSKERVSIINSYKDFGDYASDMNVNRDWYLNPNEGNVIGF